MFGPLDTSCMPAETGKMERLLNKHNVNGRRQTARTTSDSQFFSSDP